MSAIFGYGSLILPTSLVSRFEDISPPIREIYEDRDVKDQNLITEDALKKWKDIQRDIDLFPAKLYGFRRYYSRKSNRGGAMLEAIHTKSREDWINGVIIQGLNKNQVESIKKSEKDYKMLTLVNPDIEFYDEEDHSAFNESTLKIFVRESNPKELSINIKRNNIYHNRILEGIKMLKKEYNSDMVQEFRLDFLKTTYESAYNSSDSAEFNTVKENNKIKTVHDPSD